ncbi:23S rRNA (adenine(1618)-N(6))-methyltransferase RlmF [Reinekea thalattae]|uniref:Ribosomal RNA large subunit methyltransferase F n=1 Tax=Reinekea thalattae TaxID=2593301 RepID=A0A5C8ZBL2_9GAMM|nr:23S rRNA (adenine(1618)-N(6))-methyltransferase RlmF [Reinekea thalattae]TXR54200.1 23S rRNA (adenine(1618)-N(6))-methyltransferase RlmF [Reinekea thalattae]
MKPKNSLHVRNLHQGRYDMDMLVATHKELAPFLTVNPKGEKTIDFSNPVAVLELNRALLKHYYRIDYWQIPPGYLCPPIPGRSDYVHYAADLILQSANKKNFKGLNVRVLDIGTGANLIYPIVASQLYGWHVVASEVDPQSIECAATIVANNDDLASRVQLRSQSDPASIFAGVIQGDDYFQLTLCNPPFFKSKDEAAKARQRKNNNLARNAQGRGQRDQLDKASGNFGGSASELYCQGGELKFVSNMISESVNFAQQVGWFSSLISNGKHVSTLIKQLQKAGAVEHQVIEMSQGQKNSRLLAWTFKTPKSLKQLMTL